MAIDNDDATPAATASTTEVPAVPANGAAPTAGLATGDDAPREPAYPPHWDQCPNYDLLPVPLRNHLNGLLLTARELHDLAYVLNKHEAICGPLLERLACELNNGLEREIMERKLAPIPEAPSKAKQPQGRCIARSAPPECYSLRVTDEGMHPRFRRGEYATANRTIPVAPGDEVLVTLKNGTSLPRVLKSRGDRLVSLEDIQGRALTVPEEDVLSVHVIVMVSSRDLCGGSPVEEE